MRSRRGLCVDRRLGRGCARGACAGSSFLFITRRWVLYVTSEAHLRRIEVHPAISSRTALEVGSDEVPDFAKSGLGTFGQVRVENMRRKEVRVTH